MPTLHKATEETKVALKSLAAIIVGIFLITMLFRAGRAVKEYFFPTPPPPPTVSFGKLPALTFPKNQTSQKFTYSLNTVSGSLPTFSDRATIFKTEQAPSNLLALKRAQEKVKSVGFSDTGTPATEDTYIWQQTTNGIFKKLTLNILTYNFTLTSDFLINPAVSQATNLPGEPDAATKAQSFLSSLASFPADLDPGKTVVTPLTISGLNLITTTSFSNAQVLRIDFFQKDVESLPVVYPYPPLSPMEIIVGNRAEILEAHYFHQGITEISATYPIKTADAAFTQLQGGQGYIASYDGTDKNVSITNVYVAYYQSGDKQSYLEPVVVFEGKNNFKAYVQAVTDNWLE